MTAVSADFIDLDTPLNKRTTVSQIDGTVYHLVRTKRTNKCMLVGFGLKKKDDSLHSMPLGLVRLTTDIGLAHFHLCFVDTWCLLLFDVSENGYFHIGHVG